VNSPTPAPADPVEASADSVLSVIVKDLRGLNMRWCDVDVDDRNALTGKWRSLLSPPRPATGVNRRLAELRLQLTSCWEYDWRTDGMRLLFDEIGRLNSRLTSECALVQSLEAQHARDCARIVELENLRPAAGVDEEHPDTARLNWIDSECADLRCQVHRYHDDSDTYYQVVTFHMDAPKERCVGEGSDPRKAIDMAIAGSAKQGIKLLERSDIPLKAPEEPYIVQAFWSPCRKYIATVCVSNQQVSVVDDNGDVWEPTGPAQDMSKVTA
jgi:hypothetical protein